MLGGWFALAGIVFLVIIIYLLLYDPMKALAILEFVFMAIWAIISFVFKAIVAIITGIVNLFRRK